MNLDWRIKRNIVAAGILVTILLLFSLNKVFLYADSNELENTKPQKPDNIVNEYETYRDFSLNNTLHSKTGEDIHYNLYIPDSYDGSKAYALFVTLPGYQGLYFQGVGVNLETEGFGFSARNIVTDMIIVAPQLNDWGETSVKQVIELTEYFLSTYNIDQGRVYAEGYSAGGVTMSAAIGIRPELFTAYLQCSSRWNGEYDLIVENEIPIYLTIGKNDEYYGAEPTIEAYDTLFSLYKEKGLTKEQIDKILVLDVKDTDYFKNQDIMNQHEGGATLFPNDDKIMQWLFSKGTDSK